MRTISYVPLWKTMAEKGIKNKMELSRLSGVSRPTLENMSNGKPVSLSILLKIASVLDVPVESVVEFEKQ